MIVSEPLGGMAPGPPPPPPPPPARLGACGGHGPVPPLDPPMCRYEGADIGILSQAHLGDLSIGRLRQTYVSFRMFFLLEYKLGDNTLFAPSVSRIHCTICSSQKILRRSQKALC